MYTSATTEILQYLNTPQIINSNPNPFTNKNDHLQQQTPLNYNDFSVTQNFQSSADDEGDLYGLIAQGMKYNPGLETCYDDDFGSITGGDVWEYGNILSGLNTNTLLANTLSCPQSEDSAASKKGKETIQSEEQRSGFNKRKSDNTMNLKEAKQYGNKDKKLKNSMNTAQNSSTKNSTTNKDNKKTSYITIEKSNIPQFQTTDYIHVRARRGQATDSHSLAERVRREKINDKMKYLQSLVPGCNNITGKAGMIDEIINYVQALQNQVEFLSMKLGALYPQQDFNDDSYYTKEAFPANNFEFHHSVETLPEIYLPQNYQSDVLHHTGSSNDLDLPVTLGRTISTPHVSIFELPDFNYLQSYSTLETEFQSILASEFQQTSSNSPSQLTCFSGGDHVDGDVTSNNKDTSLGY